MPSAIVSNKSSQWSWNWMSSDDNYDPSLQKRKDTSTAAKKALLQKFQAAAEDPKMAQRQAERVVINEARMVRRAGREAAHLRAKLKSRKKWPEPPNVRRWPSSKPKERQRFSPPNRSSARRRLRPRKRPNVMRAMRHARLTRRCAGAATDGVGLASSAT